MKKTRQLYFLRIFIDNFDKSLFDQLKTRYEHLYFLGTDMDLDSESMEDIAHVIYEKEYTYSEDIINGTGSLTGYPESFYTENRTMFVYQINE